MRIQTDPRGDRWVVYGNYQVGEWDGTPGTQYAWQKLDQAAAGVFLDRVFGPEQAVQPQLPQ